MIYYREHSPLWKPTSKNKKLRKDVSDNNTYKKHIYDNNRLCGSHEYIGNKKRLKPLFVYSTVAVIVIIQFILPSLALLVLFS